MWHAVRVLLCFSLVGLASPSSPGSEDGPGVVEEGIAALERALRDHDFGAIEGLLAPAFRYDGHGGPVARAIMRQVVAGYPAGLEGVETLEVRREPDETLAVATVFHTADGPEEHTIRFTEDGRILTAEVARIQLAGHGTPGSAAEPQGWSVSLDRPVERLPFELREEFPVPLVEAWIGERGPYLFAVDTAAACTVLVRRRLADELKLPTLGTAAIGDASGQPTRPAERVRLPELRLGGLVARDLDAVSHTPSAAHAASIPEDVDGILGRVLFQQLLLTLDYPGRQLTVGEGSLQAGSSVTRLEFVQNIMQINVNVAGRPMPVLLDSGHRGTVTLPSSWAARLPLTGPPVDAGQTATVNVTYTRRKARLAGSVEIAGISVDSPVLFFADEHTPALLGGGLLREFSVTIDQRARLVRFERPGAGQRAGGRTR